MDGRSENWDEADVERVYRDDEFYRHDDTNQQFQPDSFPEDDTNQQGESKAPGRDSDRAPKHEE